MQDEDSVSHWIDGVRDGDAESVRQLWNRYFDRLTRLARQKLPSHIRRGFDEEDVALSAFHSVCAGCAAGRFPDLTSRDDLWALLIVITARKARYRIRQGMAGKRGGGRVRGESAVDGSGLVAGLQQLICDEPTPEFAAEMADELEQMLNMLGDESLRQMAILKMEACTNQEIADQLDCSLRTVERRLELIRRVWTTRSGADDASA